MICIIFQFKVKPRLQTNVYTKILFNSLFHRIACLDLLVKTSMELLIYFFVQTGSWDPAGLTQTWIFDSQLNSKFFMVHISQIIIKQITSCWKNPVRHDRTRLEFCRIACIRFFLILHTLRVTNILQVLQRATAGAVFIFLSI